MTPGLCSHSVAAMEPDQHALDIVPVSADYQSEAYRTRERRGARIKQAVRDCMTAGVITIAAGATVREAYRAMAKHRVNSLLVLGAEDGQMLGWLTARGLLAQMDRDPDVSRARDVVCEPVIALDPSASVDEALAALRRRPVSQVLVIRGGDRMPEGVVTPADLVAFAASAP